MLLHDFVANISATSPHLSATLTLDDFIQFISLASEVQHRAGAALRLTPKPPPPNRPTVISFFTTALSPKFPEHLINDLWTLCFPYLPSTRFDPVATIRTLGLDPNLKTKLPELFLRAPVSQCVVCPKTHNLHVHSRLNGYLYDTDGVHPVQTIILDCPGCGASYWPSYYTHSQIRHYYTPEMGRDKEILHVHCHYYITNRLAHLFRVIQMLAHVSHFNLTNWYNKMYVEDSSVPVFDPKQGFGPAMSEAVCFDGLELRALIAHEDRRHMQLSVPASGTDNVRFEEAIDSHLDRLDVEGTRFRDHYCSSCVRVKSGGVDPETGEELLIGIRAVVTNGLTIGHWRCSASTEQLTELVTASGNPPPEGPCTNRLENINDRFCAYHKKSLGNRCHVQPCRSDSLSDSKTCGDASHIEAWAKFTERVKSNFSLSAILNRPGSNLPSDPTVHLDAETGEFIDLEGVREADESNRAHEGARDGGQGKKLVTSRCRTHNDQLVVGCCGIILARKTFYHAESVSAVKHFLEDTFPQGMPEVVFYDNACRLTEHIYHGSGETQRFQGTVIPVDPFHHRSHAESDQFCKLFTDPKLFPDIQENGQWIFNASAAELTNIWYGGFASMCRNMHSLRYNFFLEEMVYLRNMWLTKKLSKRPGMEFLGIGNI